MRGGVYIRLVYGVVGEGRDIQKASICSDG